jgi:hypothetical protein
MKTMKSKTGSGVFSTCSSLSQVTLTSGLVLIGESMFSADNGPSALASIEIGAMFSADSEVISSLKSITIVSSVTSIGLFSI